MLSRIKAAYSPAWSRFADQAQKDLKVWCAFMFLLTVCRAVIIAIFHERMSPASTFGTVLAAMANGLRFDSPIAALWIAPSFALGALAGFFDWQRPAEIVRKVAIASFIILTAFLGAVTYGFFKEFDDQFNHFILNAVYDDLPAALMTVWKEHPVVWAILCMAVGDTLLYLGIMLAVKRLHAPRERLEKLSRGAKAGLTVAVTAFMVIAVRGSIGRRPVQRKDVAVTADPFLNKNVVNPYKALQYTISIHLRLAKSSGIQVFLSDGDVRAAARRYFGETGNGADLDACAERLAAGAKNPPRHVFLLVLESYSGWPLFDAYRQLRITGEMERLAGSGLLLTRFLPASTGTMTSLATIVTGLEEHGAPICYQASARRPFPSSIAPIFKRLGYRTRFFYSGYLSWQRIGDFMTDQGFEEVYGGGDIGEWYRGNEWGVTDEELFDFVLKKSSDERPTFNLVLTVCNHPPFEVDVYGKGFAMREMPPDLMPLWDRDLTLNQIGHFWYSDRCFGRFVDAIEKGLPRTLVAATADHYGRRFLNHRPSLAERGVVPFLLHGHGIAGGLSFPLNACGGHIDIMPTLAELCAPPGFKYHAIGRDLFAKDDSPVGFGADLVIGPDFVADLEEPFSWEPLPDMSPPSAPPDLQALKRRERDLKGISWWRVAKGAEFPPPRP